MGNQQIDLSAFDINMLEVQDLDDKYQEFTFFLDLLSQYNKEEHISKYRWVLSSVLNSAYSYFESSARNATISRNG